MTLLEPLSYCEILGLLLVAINFQVLTPYRQLETSVVASPVTYEGLMEFAGVDKAARSKMGCVENAGVDTSARYGKGGQCGSGQCRSSQMPVKNVL